MQKLQYQSKRPACSPAALLSKPLSQHAESIVRAKPCLEHLWQHGADNPWQPAPHTTDPGLSVPRICRGSACAVMGGGWIQPGPPHPKAALPLCPVAVAQQAWRTAARHKGAEGDPALLQGSLSPTDKPAGRDKGCCLQTLRSTVVCQSVRERGNFHSFTAFQIF